jgi:hypothetical protein
MASAADATIVLELYKLRQEATLRAARQFIAFEFWPKDLEELRSVTRAPGTPQNAQWRQATSYWEMAASLVLRGAVDPDLFFDSNVEGVLLYAKYHHWHVETEKASGNLFMNKTATLIEQYPAAKLVYEAMLKGLQPKA